MELNLERVRNNVRAAATEDLLDRVTAYRAGMEPEALTIIEAELEQRGVTDDAIAAHAARRSEAIMLPDGTAMKCSFCYRPAIGRRWGWHRLWGRLPVFPRRYAYCSVHANPAAGPDSGESPTD